MHFEKSVPRLVGRYAPTGLLKFIITAVNRFFYSPLYVFIIAAMAAVANIWALDLEMYTAYVAIAVIMCLLCRDLLPIVPMTICCYIIPSNGNNPAVSDSSIFSSGNGGEYILVLAAITAAFVIFRLCMDNRLGFKHMFRTQYRLLFGIVILGIAYMISGLGLKNYGELAEKNIFFAFLQFVALALPYCLLAGAVKWDEAPRDYLAYVGTAVGLTLLAELINVFLTQEIIVDGILKRELIHTGWGIHNNIGGLLAMLLPFPFYLACKHRISWVGILTGTLLMAGIIMTNSRSSMLIGAGIYLLCIVLTIIFTKDKIGAVCAVGVILAVVVIFIYRYWDQIVLLFDFIINYGWNPNGRDEIYENGIRQFLEHPIFGGTFYPIDYVPFDYSELEAFSSFFPPRWHNTVIQLLACCGIAGLAAYVIHRAQTIWVLVRKPSLLKTFIGLSVLALMASSMLDCHFFNIGPVLFYSMALAFGEKSEITDPRGKYEHSPGITESSN